MSFTLFSLVSALLPLHSSLAFLSLSVRCAREVAMVLESTPFFSSLSFIWHVSPNGMIHIT